MSLLGRSAYHLLHRPLRFIRRLGKGDGFPQTARARKGRRQLVEAALSLAPMPVEAEDDPTRPLLVYMTGRDYWPLAVWAYASLARVAPDFARPCFLSDGSLDEDLARRLRDLFPGCLVRTRAEVEADLEANLPASRYPVLRRCRDQLPITRKLLDLHAGQRGWKLHLDSDTVFFRRPDFLYRWRDAPENLYMRDVDDVYGYPPELLARILGRPVLPRVNAGMAGLKSECIDFELLEDWARRLELAGGLSWFIDQCLTAMMMTHAGGVVAPVEDYLIMPSPQEARFPRAVFHHYSGASRSFLYTHAWRHTRRGLTEMGADGAGTQERET